MFHLIKKILDYLKKNMLYGMEKKQNMTERFIQPSKVISTQKLKMIANPSLVKMFSLYFVLMVILLFCLVSIIIVLVR